MSATGQMVVLGSAGFEPRAQGRLGDALAPMEAALERGVEQGNREEAATGAGNLSELLLVLGRLGDAEARAGEAVDHADTSGDAFLQMGTRTALADALHQQGRSAEAATLFEAAERLQAARQAEYPLLYSLPGYRRCDLLLSGGDATEARRRAQQTLVWAERHHYLLDIALQHLTLGRALLALAPDAAGLAAAAAELDRAVAGLRTAGQQPELPRGLLARAACHRRRADRAHAQRDLDEARALCERCGMKLFLADVHLEQARLYLAFGEPEGARPEFEQARALVAELGYHRRDPEVRALAESLGPVN